jgi:hypothetical protein
MGRSLLKIGGGVLTFSLTPARGLQTIPRARRVWLSGKSLYNNMDIASPLWGKALPQSSERVCFDGTAKPTQK